MWRFSMKKRFIFILFAVMAISFSCESMTWYINISNLSKEDAVVIIHDSSKKTKTIKSGETITVRTGRWTPVSISSIGRNYLKKIDNEKYEIKDLSPVNFTVKNTTDEVAILKEKHKLFDDITIPAKTSKVIQAYNTTKLNPYAYNDDGLLEVKMSKSNFLKITN